MITGKEGGFIHRFMPPIDWDCGPIPESCYDPDLSPGDIREKLVPVYLDPKRIRKLADSDEKIESIRAEMALNVLAEMDAYTIWSYNISRSIN